MDFEEPQDCMYISTEKGGAVELLFKDEDSDD